MEESKEDSKKDHKPSSSDPKPSKEDSKKEKEDSKKEKEDSKKESNGKRKHDDAFHKDKHDKDRKKKKKKKKRTRNDDSAERRLDDEEEMKKKIKESKVWESKNIPEMLKEKFASIESNPLILIIANIPINVTLEELREYFNTLLISLKQNFGSATPVKSLEIGETKNFAIIEFNNKEWKRVCSGLENLEYQGFKLMIKKPKGFFESIYEKKDSADPFGNIVTNPTEFDNKIYMGGLPTYLKDEDVKKLCESYGMLKYFNLVKDSSAGQPVSKGYCFFEYVDVKVTDKAIKGLNMLEIGDKKLKVQRASTGANKSLVVAQTKQPSNSSGSFLGSYPNLREASIQIMLNIPLSAMTPSRVVQFLNMASFEDLLEDDFYQDLMEDIREECAKFGPIEKIEIPRPDSSTGLAGPAVGKVFVKFLYLIPAKRARHYLSGRTYNKRTILASFYPEDKFDLKEYLIKG